MVPSATLVASAFMIRFWTSSINERQENPQSSPLSCAAIFFFILWNGGSPAFVSHPPHHGDQAQRWDRQQVIEATHYGWNQIQQPDLTNPETRRPKSFRSETTRSFQFG